MSGEARTSGAWLRGGCLGCAGLLVVLLVGVGVLLSLGQEAARSQQITTRRVEEPLPAMGPRAGAEPHAGDRAGPSPDAPPLALPDFDPESDPGPGPGTRPGRVLIDLSQGEFRVKPAPPGEPLRVEAEFDEKHYELITQRDAETGGEWSYAVRFRQTGATGLVSILARLMGARDPRVTVFLPRDVPMDLDLRFSQGGGQIDLGGLWLADARVAFTQGGGDLEFSEPLREPAESLSIDASMGGGSFRRLGNASPRTLRVEAQMGGGDVDLGGSWRRDCAITLASRMGGLSVHLPDGVITRGLPHDRAVPGGAEGASPPTLTFSYSSSMGEIDFQR